MPGSVEYLIWFLGTFLEAVVVVCALRRKIFKRYFFLNLYMLLDCLASFARFRVIEHNGVSSSTYRYFYFYSDALLTLVLFFGLISLYVLVFQELKIDRHLRMGAVVLLAGTAWFSYQVVSQSSTRMLTGFAFELSQNLYFVGLILTYILWGAVVKLREARAHVIQLVLSLGLYFSAFAASYAISNLRPDLYPHMCYLVPIMGCLLPLSWAYTFWRVPQDTFLSPARLAAVSR